MISLRTLVLTACVTGWTEDVSGQTPPGSGGAGQQPTAQQPTQQQVRELPPPTEVVVVTASRREEQLINAPATMTVITDDFIRIAPSQEITDLLRLVPGINVVQTAVRDVNITSRTATGTLTNSLLVLVDGRSFYQDFFGNILWDFLPIDPEEIKQIEVIRGPASAVWGPNALTGVVNVISKTPRELDGTALSMRFGLLDRTRDGGRFDGGGVFSVNATHANAPSDRFAFKVSAGVLTQESFLRPIGTVPGQSATYPAFDNKGTTQPRLDARADYDFADKRQKIILAGGIAGTDGIIHTGLGPLEIQRGSTLKYGRLTYSRDRFKLQAFVNALDAEAPVLLQRGIDGRPLDATFENQVYDVEFSNQHILGTTHLISYGGNYRHNSFDLSLAPLGDNRDEGGLYVQDQIFLTERLRWVLGGRLDVFDTLDKAVFSPRTAFIIKVRPTQTLRVSFNRSFRSPSFVNNFFELDFFSQIQLETGPFPYRSKAIGNPTLREEALTAYEIGYIGMVGRLTLGAAIYLNRAENIIQFTQDASYTSSNPPPGWPLAPEQLDEWIAAGQGLPSQYTYRNFDHITERGVELSVEAGLARGINGFANYTWQALPKVEGFEFSEVNQPPTYHVNAGINAERGRYFGSISVSVEDGAFWQDILNPAYHGYTSAYANVDGCLGVRSVDGTMTIAVRGTNLLNRSTQQHVFGDLIKRTITGEVRFTF